MTNAYETCLDTMYALGRFGIVLGLSTIESILENLDNPQNDFISIHIAGTNGKGSVAATLSSILHTAGYRTGLYTSPHLVKFNERICIDNTPVTDDEVVELYDAVKGADKGERQATFFEITTAMALYEFSRKKVDFAIIETGMGGRLDATNIINPALSIITNISLEHKSYLGNTLKEIAGEKGGIIKQNTPVVTAVRQPNASDTIYKIAHEKAAPLYRLGSDFRVRRNGTAGSFSYYGVKGNLTGLQTKLAGDHQVDNAALVLAACELLNMGKTKISDEHIIDGMASTKWPGRLEIVDHNPMTIIDGAHNPAAVKKLSQYLKENLAGKKITLVTGILDDKAYSEMLRHLLPICSRIILTRAKTERSVDPEKMRGEAMKLHSDVEVIPDIAMAIERAQAKSSPEDVICIAGSLYVAGEAKEFFG